MLSTNIYHFKAIPNDCQIHMYILMHFKVARTQLRVTFTHYNLQKCPGAVIFRVHVGHLARSSTHISVQWLWTPAKLPKTSFSFKMFIFTSLLLLHHISHYENAYLWLVGGSGGVFSQGIWGVDTKILTEFILFLILKQINHRSTVWRFSYFPECRLSRCAHTVFPTLISAEKNCETDVTTHFSAKGQKA